MTSASTTTRSPGLLSQFTLRHLTIGIEVINLFVNGYLSYTKATNASVSCIEGDLFNCDAVTNSIYSTIAGIPVAYLGFALHVAVFLVLLIGPRLPVLREYGTLVAFGLTLFGFAFHGYLTFASVAWIQALCIWCLSAHTLTTLSLVLTSVRTYREFLET